MSKQIITNFPESKHNHDKCVSDALLAAERLCSERRLRLTALRRRVLEIVWTNHKAMGAYDILKMLGGEAGGMAPPTVYRALEFLLQNGLIHRIESLNAFVGCSSPDQPHGGQFLICKNCGATAELDDEALLKRITDRAEQLGFEVEKQTIEISGVCPSCFKD